jgi:hypothetical protein
MIFDILSAWHATAWWQRSTWKPWFDFLWDKLKLRYWAVGPGIGWRVLQKLLGRCEWGEQKSRQLFDARCVRPRKLMLAGYSVPT